MNTEQCRNDYTDRLLQSYAAYYDVSPSGNKDGFIASCDFNVHSEKYVLSKKAKLWETEGNEYVYIFSKAVFTEADFNEFRDYAYDHGIKKVMPKSGHMYSYITLIVVCDVAEPEAVKALKKLHIHRTYLFSFHGWMDMHAALVSLSDGSVVSNSAGRSNVKTLKELYQFERKKKK